MKGGGGGKLPIPLGGSGPSPKTWILGPTQVRSPNGTSIGSSVFVRLTVVSDRQTDRQTDRHAYHATSVVIGHTDKYSLNTDTNSLKLIRIPSCSLLR